MKNLLSLILAVVSVPLFAQDLDSTEVSSTIKDVTVFLEGAEITRSGKVHLKAGEQVVVLPGLPYELVEKSVQVNGLKVAKITNVSADYEAIDYYKKDKWERSKEDEIEAIKRNIRWIREEVKVLQIEERLLMDNSEFAENREGVSIEEIKAAAEYYRTRIGEIR